ALDLLHGPLRGRRCPARADVGTGAPAADAHRPHHEHGTGLRRVLRGHAGRGVPDVADAAGRRARARRDADRGAGAAPADRGRSQPHRRVTDTVTPSTSWMLVSPTGTHA